MMKGREKVKPGAGSQPALLEKHQGGRQAQRPHRRTNHYQQYYMPSQHIYCRRVLNLIQACDVQSSDQKMYIPTPRSPEVENFQMKIHFPARDRILDLLIQRQTCCHLSQRGIIIIIMIFIQSNKIQLEKTRFYKCVLPWMKLIGYETAISDIYPWQQQTK